MNNKTELTAADLAMYLGCEIEWAGDTGYTLAGINTGQSDFNPVGIIDTAGNPIWLTLEDIKPILRPLSDMTEEELLEFAKLCSGAEYVEIVESAISNYKNVMCFADFHDSERLVVNDRGEVWYASYFQNKPAGRNTINHHEQTVWLLRHHFDIFEWAKAGLAIDKTKTVTP